MKEYLTELGFLMKDNSMEIHNGNNSIIIPLSDYPLKVSVFVNNTEKILNIHEDNLSIIKNLTELLMKNNHGSNR